MVKRLIQTIFSKFGLEVHRKFDLDLPFVHTVRCADDVFPFWIANQHSRTWWAKPEVSANAEVTALRALCPPGSTVVEVGAHHGFFTVLLSRWAGATGRVDAIEANALNALVLDANLNLNRLTNCSCTFAAGGARSGTIRMAGESVAGAKSPGREVRQVALDDFLEEKGINRVDLLKVDVEGFEAEVLRGGRRLLESRPAIALELHLDDLERFGESAQSVLGLLHLEQYVGELMARPNWDTLKPFRGLDDLPKGGVVNLFLRPREEHRR